MLFKDELVVWRGTRDKSALFGALRDDVRTRPLRAGELARG